MQWSKYSYRANFCTANFKMAEICGFDLTGYLNT
jgi:hypothetical protein|nr:MAG TPA: hypothetical protein [Caudoviricetes sp.]